jgi:hypothetical protein
MKKKKYFFVAHPTNERLQLTSDDRVLLLFSSEALAQQRRDKAGLGGNIRERDLDGLAREFSPCCQVILDPSENPTMADAIRICDLK